MITAKEAREIATVATETAAKELSDKQVITIMKQVVEQCKKGGFSLELQSSTCNNISIAVLKEQGFKTRMNEGGDYYPDTITISW